MDTRAETVELGGVSIAYRDTRTSAAMHLSTPPVVLVHGMGGDSSTWDRFAKTLTDLERRVVTVDLRGHGRSEHTAHYDFDEFGLDLLRLLDHLEITEADIVGHSLGAYAATVVAQRNPSLVRRLVLEELPIPISAGDPPPNLTARFPSLSELWHATTSVLFHPRAMLAFDRSMTSTALTQFRKPNPRWWDALSTITAPTLFLRGGPTGMVDTDRLDKMAAAIPDCRIEVFRTGHSIHRDGHREFDAAVLPFLSTWSS